jgi:hypothetical protein
MLLFNLKVKQTGTGRRCLFRVFEADDFGKLNLFPKRQFESEFRSIGNTRKPMRNLSTAKPEIHSRQ